GAGDNAASACGMGTVGAGNAFVSLGTSGVLFAAFAGFTYWFPKAFGFRLHEGWGKAAFWFTLAGYVLVFVPLYIVGLLGMTRRLQHINMDLWTP
ncbi:cbb3-type cytochrome c oxidase subunit I, partial [Mesorhizobium sp. M2D.F.Ca.ET.140.01.1.1]|uniref:cbb3-type cytochrome c oxidase subunit I n=1 Tax=Mesorhizobium sp. M2D.F.Ca.ET.140.01.1.1 TaxID=2496664 RepID=UPI001FE174EB